MGRFEDFMKGTAKTWLILIGAVIVFFLRLGSAEAAKLRYIRIGEHETFTRIVFEFPGPVRFKDPVIKGKGKLCVVFLDTTTALPQQIPCETTKQVDSIEFVQQESHLTANVAFSFPYFRLKSFSLSKPQRVVVDVHRLSAPFEGAAFEQPVQEKPSDKTKTLPTEKEAKTKPKGPAAKEAPKHLEEPAKISAKPATQVTEQDLAKPPQEIATPPPAQPGEPTTDTARKATQVTAPEAESLPETESLPLSAKQGRLQIYLLAVLIVLSAMIILLLAFIFFKKTRVSKPAQPGRALDELAEADEGVAEIDTKIKQQFAKYDQS